MVYNICIIYDGYVLNISLIEDENLEEMNFYYRSWYMINMVFNVIFLVFGVLGNVLVIYVYRMRLRKKRYDDWYYVVVLVVMDLCYSMFLFSFVFVKNFYLFMFLSDVLCKFLLYGINVFFCLFFFLLLIVCVYRYRKICRFMS